MRKSYITQNLCSLLDQEEQQQAALTYSFESLCQDLLNLAGGLSIKINTHEYNAAVENRVTQSDLGLIINYINYYEQDNCWTESWLFQAKVLKPSNDDPVTYLAESKFDSTSPSQIDRIKTLKTIVNADFIRFMEYCPRANLLSRKDQDKLIYYRNFALAHNIFDYALGLELHDCLVRADQSLEPGIFISDVEENNNIKKSYLDLYKNFWQKSYPFSWFILSRLSHPQESIYRHISLSKKLNNNRIKIDPFNRVPKFDESNIDSAVLAHAIVRCDPVATKYILRNLGDNRKGNFTIYPARTIKIDIRVGGD